MRDPSVSVRLCANHRFLPSIIRHCVDVRAPRLQRTSNFRERLRWPQNVFKHVLCDDHIEGLIPERESLNILALLAAVELSSRYIGKELTRDVPTALQSNLVRGRPAGRRLMNPQLPPSRKMIVENLYESSLPGYGSTSRAKVLVTKPRTSLPEPHFAVADHAVPSIRSLTYRLKRPKHAAFHGTNDPLSQRKVVAPQLAKPAHSSPREFRKMERSDSNHSFGSRGCIRSAETPARLLK